MAQKAQDFVNQSMTTAQNVISSLQQAANMAEKPENKEKIQQAMNSINSACNALSSYQD